jgi:hypothetical protein
MEWLESGNMTFHKNPFIGSRRAQQQADKYTVRRGEDNDWLFEIPLQTNNNN